MKFEKKYENYETLMKLYAHENPFYHFHYQLVTNGKEYVLYSNTCGACICCSPYEKEEFQSDSFSNLIGKLPDKFIKKMKNDYILFCIKNNSEKYSYREDITKSILGLNKDTIFCKSCRKEFIGKVEPHDCTPYYQTCRIKGCRDFIIGGNFTEHIHGCMCGFSSIDLHNFEKHVSECYKVRCKDCGLTCYWIYRKTHNCVNNPLFNIDSDEKFIKLKY